MELKGSSVPDQSGSPLKVSAILTYKIVDPVASLFNVGELERYLKDQGLEVIKRVLSRFPYKSTNRGEHSLLNDTIIIGEAMARLTRRQVHEGSAAG